MAPALPLPSPTRAMGMEEGLALHNLSSSFSFFTTTTTTTAYCYHNYYYYFYPRAAHLDDVLVGRGSG